MRFRSIAGSDTEAAGLARVKSGSWGGPSGISKLSGRWHSLRWVRGNEEACFRDALVPGWKAKVGFATTAFWLGSFPVPVRERIGRKSESSSRGFRTPIASVAWFGLEVPSGALRFGSAHGKRAGFDGSFGIWTRWRGSRWRIGRSLKASSEAREISRYPVATALGSARKQWRG